MSAHRIPQTLVLLVLAALTLGGCNDKLKKENEALYQQNLQLQNELSDSMNDLEACQAERSTLLSQISTLESENASLKSELASPPPVTATANNAAANFGGPGVSVTEDAAKITVRVTGDILFASGQATLQSAAKRTLSRIAGVLNSQYPGNTVRVEGHTDSDPIRKSKWRDNYHLSEARATAVRDYLISKGVSRNRLMIVGHGPDLPVASNSTRTGKAQNRRVEIIVVK